MIWQSWLEGVATGLSVTTQQAGIIIAFLGTASLVLISIVAVRGRDAGKVGGIVAFLFVILFTFMEWIPVFMGSIVAFIMAFYVAYAFTGRILGL